jgi:hypothetical protein
MKQPAEKWLIVITIPILSMSIANAYLPIFVFGSLTRLPQEVVFNFVHALLDTVLAAFVLLFLHTRRFESWRSNKRFLRLPVSLLTVSQVLILWGLLMRVRREGWELPASASLGYACAGIYVLGIGVMLATGCFAEHNTRGNV